MECEHAHNGGGAHVLQPKTHPISSMFFSLK